MCRLGIEVAVRGRWPLMLRTGWVVVRRMTRVWPSANSMARAVLVSETSTVATCPAWLWPRAFFPATAAALDRMGSGNGVAMG